MKTERLQIPQIKTFVINPENPALTDQEVNEYCTNNFNGNWPTIIPSNGYIHVIRNELKEVTRL